MDVAFLPGPSFPAGAFRVRDIRRSFSVSAAGDSSGGGGGGARIPSSSEGRKKKDGDSEGRRSKDVSVMEVRRLIGVSEEEGDGGLAEDGGRKSQVMDFWASTPIGQEESAPEKKLREIGEWLVVRSESQSIIGQQILLAVFLYILPLWIVLLLLASGTVKLPFDVPFLDDLLS